MKKKKHALIKILEEKNNFKIASLEFLKPALSISKKHRVPRRPMSEALPGAARVSRALKPASGPDPVSHDAEGDSAGASGKISSSAFPPSAVSFNHLSIPDAPDVAAPSSEGSNLTFLMRQVERLQDSHKLLQQRLDDLERRSAPSEQEIQRKAKDDSSREEGLRPQISHPLSEEPYYRDQITGKPVCPRCITEDRTSVLMKPSKIYLATVSDCPHCHKKLLTRQEEREPIIILPPEDPA